MAHRSSGKTNNPPPKAMRHFNHKLPRNRNAWSKKAEHYISALFPIAIIAGISAAGVWAGFQYNKASGIQNSNKQNESTQSSLNQDITVRKAQFLKTYTEAKVSSPILIPDRLEVTGTYLDEDGIHIFSGTFDLAGNGSFQIDFSESVTLTFEKGKLISETPSLFESDITAIKTFVDAIQDPLLTLKEANRDQLKELESTRFKGRDAYAAHIKTDTPEQEITLIVNASDYSLVERHNGSPLQPEQIYHYSEYRNVAGIRLPFTISIANNKNGPFRINLSSLNPEGTTQKMANLLL
jgi:hypothetical protein